MRQYIGTHQLTVVTTDVTVNNIDFSKLHYTVRTLALPCVLGVTLVALCLMTRRTRFEPKCPCLSTDAMSLKGARFQDTNTEKKITLLGSPRALNKRV